MFVRNCHRDLDKRGSCLLRIYTFHWNYYGIWSNLQFFQWYTSIDLTASISETGLLFEILGIKSEKIVLNEF